ncbi:MAG: class I mannose-6-phosphate isomerase [Clostridia bacterium]|nr:class I mannose-6-phosphate isomerase [Clostridia bacterium]
MQAVLLRPALKEIVWGGNRLKNEFGYESDLNNIAEAWVVSAHPAGVSTAVGEKYDGMGLDEIVAAEPALVGEGFTGDFPLMVKFIDAARDLSIQVHPDDEYAAAHEGGYGKTEMWYVMAAEPGAFLYYGMKKDVTPEQFAAAIADGSVCELLNRVECKPGDCFFIPAKTVHAIGAGLLICEIQQSANITYRIFDYNRPGADGKPRELHVQKASEVSDLCAIVPDAAPQGAPETVDGLTKTLLRKCDRFTAVKCDCSAEASDCDEGFALLSVLDGEAELITAENTLKIKKGDGVFLPAGLGEYRIRGVVSYIKSTL